MKHLAFSLSLVYITMGAMHLYTTRRIIHGCSDVIAEKYMVLFCLAQFSRDLYFDAEFLWWAV